MQEVGRVFVTPASIFAGDVVPELVGGGFGKEVGASSKDLSVVKFTFNGRMDTFDIRVGVGTSGWIEAVGGFPFLLDGLVEAFGLIVDGISIELDAQIGLDHSLGAIHTMGFEVSHEAVDGEGGIRFG